MVENCDKCMKMLGYGERWWSVVGNGGSLSKLVGNCGNWWEMVQNVLPTILPFCVLDIACVYVFYVGLCVQCVLCGSNKATSRCLTLICDGIILFESGKSDDSGISG